jgi:hypothetical protein
MFTKILVSLLTLALSFPAFAATLPQSSNVFQLGQGGNTGVPSITLPFSERTKLITLVASENMSTSGNYHRLVKAGAQTTSQENYTVGASDLYCFGFYFSSDTSGLYGFGYGTAAVTEDNSSSPAGEKRFWSNDNQGTIKMAATTGTKPEFYAIPMVFPATTMPFVKALAASMAFTINMLCYQP